MKILIYRPAVSSGLGAKAAPAMIAVGESSKHIIQIVQLLEERSMSFSFCLNRSDILILCGMALLYQSLGLKYDSAVSKDNEKLANAVIKIVEKANTPGSLDFKRVAGLLITLDEPAPQSLPTPPRQSPEACMPAPTYRTSPPASLAPHNRKQSSLGLHTSASVSETDLLLQQEKLRRMAMPPTPSQHGPDQYRARSRQSFDGLPRREPQMTPRDHRLSLSQAQAAQAAMMARVSTVAPGQQNLDYLSLSSTPQSQPSSPIQARAQQQSQQPQQSQRHPQQTDAFDQLQQKMSTVSSAEWDSLLGSIENGQMNLYDAMYGGPGILLAETPVSSTSASAGTANWSPEPWDMTTFNLNDFAPGPATTQSALSLSEESLSSGDDLAPSEIGLSVGSLDFRGGMMPVTNGWDGLEGFL